MIRNLAGFYASDLILEIVSLDYVDFLGYFLSFKLARMEEGRTAFKILTGTPAGKRPF